MTKPPIFVYIEDDELSRTVMKSVLLRKLGYSHLFIFEDSADIITRIESLPYKPDVFFLDIHMTPINGIKILTMLRQHPIHHDSMIIAVTASVMSEEVDELRNAGFNGVIAKPLNLDTFSDKLERILTGNEVWDIV